jgi:hypothetical protein
MSLKAKRLVNSYEERMLEFLQTCIDENYKVCTQVSLSQICEPDSVITWELRKFLFSSSAVDAVIIDGDFMPCLAVEFQSSYHDNPTARERDYKKATLLSMAGVPLVYSRIQDFGLLRLYTETDEVVFNLFTTQGYLEAKAFIQKHYLSTVTQLSALQSA